MQSPGKVGAAPAQERGLRRDFAGCLPSAPPGGLSNPAVSFLLQAKGVGWINTKITKRSRLSPTPNPSPRPWRRPPPSGRGKQCPALSSSTPGPKRSSQVRPGARKAAPAPQVPPPPGEPGGRPASASGRGGGGSWRPARSDGLPSDPRHREGADRCGPGCRGWK